MSTLKTLSGNKSSPLKIAILGAGISGLSAAYFLQKKWGSKVELSLFEASGRAGGWIRSVEKDGFLFELGPHSLRVHENDDAFILIKELELENQILYANSHAKSRYLFLNGHLQKVPNWRTWLSLYPLLCKELFVKRSSQEETVAAFFSRRFSSRIVDSFIDPLMKGIYGGDPHLLSMKSCLPQLLELEQAHGSILRGLILQRKKTQKIITLKNGLESLIQSLAGKLKNSIHFSTPVHDCTFREGKAYVNDQPFDFVISALPGTQTCKLFGTASFQFASFAIVNLGFKQLQFPVNGFGYLVPSKENQSILGAIFDSVIFPKQYGARITVMMGGWKQEGFLDLGENKILEIAIKNLEKHLKISLIPNTYLVTKLHQAVPQYFLGHSKAIDSLVAAFTPHPISFIGNSLNGVSVVDCIANAKKCTESINIIQ